MTAGELIERLKDLDPSTELWIDGWPYGETQAVPLQADDIYWF